MYQMVAVVRYCCTTVTLLLYSCYTCGSEQLCKPFDSRIVLVMCRHRSAHQTCVVTLLLHCCYNVVTLVLHCCCTAVTPLAKTRSWPSVLRVTAKSITTWCSRPIRSCVGSVLSLGWGRGCFKQPRTTPTTNPVITASATTITVSIATAASTPIITGSAANKAEVSYSRVRPI
jgi:hypothetical protein